MFYRWLLYLLTHCTHCTAGHGVEEKGENYLIPTAYKEEDALRLDYKALKVATVLENLNRAGCHLSLVLLDACRSSALPARSLGGASRNLGRGLAKIEAPTGTLVSFACAPGTTASDGEGRNGVYTEQLLQHLPKSEDIEFVMRYVVHGVETATNGKQVPFRDSSLKAKPGQPGIYLIEPPKVAEAAPAAAPTAPRTSSVSALDEAAAAGADVAGLTQWLARIGLAKHESSVIPRLVSAGVLNVAELEEMRENTVAELGLPVFERQKLQDALKALVAERKASTASANLVKSISQFEKELNFAQLVATMRTHAGNVDVQEQGLRAQDAPPPPMPAPAPVVERQQPVQIPAPEEPSGSGDAVDRALGVLAALSTASAESVSGALRTLTAACGTGQAAYVVASGGLTSVVSSMRRHSNNPAVLADACLVLGVVTHESDAAEGTLGQSPCNDGEAVSALCAAMIAFPKVAALQATASWALWGVVRGSEGNAKRAVVCKGPAALVAAIGTHVDSTEVGQSASGALLAIASTGQVGQEAVADARGVAAVMLALTTHRSIKFQGEFEILREWFKAEGKRQ